MVLSPYIKQRFEDDNGSPLRGGTVETYRAGSETSIATYTDAQGTAFNKTVITLDARGECDIYLDPTIAYKFIVRSRTGELIHFKDDITVSGDGTVTEKTILPVYTIDGQVPYSSTWLTDIDGSTTPIAPNGNTLYVIQTAGEYKDSINTFNLDTMEYTKLQVSPVGAPEKVAYYAASGQLTDSRFKTDDNRNLYNIYSNVDSSKYDNIVLNENNTINGNGNNIAGPSNNVVGSQNTISGAQNTITDSDGSNQVGYVNSIDNSDEVVQIGYNNDAVNSSDTSLAVGRAINLDNATSTRCFGDQMNIKNVSNRNFFGKYFNIDNDANFDNTFGGDGSRSQFTGQWADKNGNYYNEVDNYALSSDDGRLVYKQFVVPDENLWILDGNFVKLKDQSKAVELNNAGATALTMSGDLVIAGNIYQNGTAYETHLEQIITTKDKITMRDGAVSALPPGEESGVRIAKYDGVNDAVFGVDQTGTFRVGDDGDEAPLVLRSEAGDLTDGNILEWDAAGEKLVDAGIKPSDINSQNLDDVLKKGSSGTATESINMSTPSGRQLSLNDTGLTILEARNAQTIQFRMQDSDNTSYKSFVFNRGSFYANSGDIDLGGPSVPFRDIYQSKKNVKMFGAGSDGELADNTGLLDAKVNGQHKILTDGSATIDWTDTDENIVTSLNGLLGNNWVNSTTGQTHIVEVDGNTSTGNPDGFGNTYGLILRNYNTSSWHLMAIDDGVLATRALLNSAQNRSWKVYATTDEINKQTLDDVLGEGSTSTKNATFSGMEFYESVGAWSKIAKVGEPNPRLRFWDTGITSLWSKQDGGGKVQFRSYASDGIDTLDMELDYTKGGLVPMTDLGANIGSVDKRIGRIYQELENATVIGTNSGGRHIDNTSMLNNFSEQIRLNTNEYVDITISNSNYLQDAAFEVMVATGYNALNVAGSIRKVFSKGSYDSPSGVYTPIATTEISKGSDIADYYYIEELERKTNQDLVYRIHCFGYASLGNNMRLSIRKLSDITAINENTKLTYTEGTVTAETAETRREVNTYAFASSTVSETSVDVTSADQDGSNNIAIVNPFSNKLVQVHLLDGTGKSVEADEKYVTDTTITLNFISSLTGTYTVAIHGVDKS